MEEREIDLVLDQRVGTVANLRVGIAIVQVGIEAVIEIEKGDLSQRGKEVETVINQD